VVLEGLDGCGKSTQAGRLVARLRAAGRDVVHTREPGGTPLGERVRDLLLDPSLGEVAAMAEVFLYQASRAQLVETVVRPALEAGRVVVCERWHHATRAYQGAYEGLGRRPSEDAIETTSRLATGGTEPDRVVLLDLPAEAADERVGAVRDRLEARGDAYRAHVGARFRALFEADPAHCRIVPARGSVADVEARVWETVRDLFA
jgi:dTMP kinase